MYRLYDTGFPTLPVGSTIERPDTSIPFDGNRICVGCERDTPTFDTQSGTLYLARLPGAAFGIVVNDLKDEATGEAKKISGIYFARERMGKISLLSTVELDGVGSIIRANGNNDLFGIVGNQHFDLWPTPSQDQIADFSVPVMGTFLGMFDKRASA